MNAVADVLAIVLAITGALLALVASVGLHRLGDTRSRMHAATKPATLGVICCAVAAMVRIHELDAITKIVVVVALQLITAPVGAHVLARAITIDEGESATGHTPTPPQP
jgi:multicomponent Na+:H+ antiporter subunit G